MFTSGSCVGAQCGEVEEVAADTRQVQKHQRDKNSFIFGLPMQLYFSNAFKAYSKNILVQKLPRDKNSFHFGMLPVTGIGSELQRIGMMRTVSGDVQFALKKNYFVGSD